MSITVNTGRRIAVPLNPPMFVTGAVIRDPTVAESAADARLYQRGV
jgi:hypothetical protein